MASTSSTHRSTSAHACQAWASIQHRTNRGGPTLRAFLVEVSATVKGRIAGRERAKPDSCMAYPLAVIRVHKRRGVNLPSKGLTDAKLGLCNEYIVKYGPRSLIPRRAAPWTWPMLHRLLDLGGGTLIDGKPWLVTPLDTTLREMTIFLMNTGARVDELINPLHCLTRGDLLWRIGGVAWVDPPEEELRKIRIGDTNR